MCNARRSAARSVRTPAVLALLLILTACGRAARDPAPVPTGPHLVQIGRFAQPTYVVSPPGDPRLFVVERKGRIRVVVDGKTLPEPFLDLRDEVGSLYPEQGLFSVAFPPGYESSGLFYVQYSDRNGDDRIAEYRARGNRADPRSRRELLFLDHPFVQHYGGLLLFHGDKLMVGLGDGGPGGDPHDRAQDLSQLFGKILRIDPRPSGDAPYTVPPDNPFVGRPGARGEVWAYGLRNPWRYWFDPETDYLYVADVGEVRSEEINVVPPPAQAGANYGWPLFEAELPMKNVTIDQSRLVMPALTYGHTKGGACSVTGGFIAREGSFAGWYLFGDYCSGKVTAARFNQGKLVEQTSTGLEVPQLSSFGQDASGAMYLASLEGPVYRLEG